MIDALTKIEIPMVCIILPLPTIREHEIQIRRERRDTLQASVNAAKERTRA